MKKTESIVRITEILGDIKEVTLDEFGWMLYVYNMNLVSSKEGKLFIFKTAEILGENENNVEEKPPRITQIFSDIVYAKQTDETARYVGFNMKKNKTHLTKTIPDAVGEREESYYVPIMPIGTYYTDIAFEAIKKEEIVKEKK